MPSDINSVFFPIRKNSSFIVPMFLRCYLMYTSQHKQVVWHLWEQSSGNTCENSLFICVHPYSNNKEKEFDLDFTDFIVSLPLSLMYFGISPW